MLRAATLSLFVLTTALASGAQTAISERIGDTLEASEREYFGLFPSIFAPLPWELVSRPDSVLIRRQGRVLRALSREDADRLGRLVDTFEDFPSVVDNPNWLASRDFVVYIDAKTPVPFGSGSQLIRVKTPEGSYSGFALYTTESALVMAPEVFARDASLPGAYAIPRANVLAVDRERSYAWQSWGPVLGLGVGAAAGAALPLGIDRRAAASFGALAGVTVGALSSELARGGLMNTDPSALDGLALFNGPRPPELPAPDLAAERAARGQPRSAPPQARGRTHEWISVGVHGAISTSGSGQDPVDVTLAGAGTSTRNVLLERADEPLDVGYRLDLSVRPIRWFRAGLFAGRYTSGSAPVAELEGEQVLRTAGSIRPYAEAILPLARWGDRRVEVFGGGGWQSHDIRVTQRPPPTVNVSSSETPNPVQTVSSQQTSGDEGSALFYNAGLEIFTSRFSSFFVRHAWHPLPTLDVAVFENRSARDDTQVIRTVAPHSVDFSYREVTVGSRFHF